MQFPPVPRAVPGVGKTCKRRNNLYAPFSPFCAHPFGRTDFQWQWVRGLYPAQKCHPLHLGREERERLTKTQSLHTLVIIYEMPCHALAPQPQLLNRPIGDSISLVHLFVLSALNLDVLLGVAGALHCSPTVMHLLCVRLFVSAG